MPLKVHGPLRVVLRADLGGGAETVAEEFLNWESLPPWLVLEYGVWLLPLLLLLRRANRDRRALVIVFPILVLALVPVFLEESWSKPFGMLLRGSVVCFAVLSLVLDEIALVRGWRRIPFVFAVVMFTWLSSDYALAWLSPEKGQVTASLGWPPLSDSGVLLLVYSALLAVLWMMLSGMFRGGGRRLMTPLVLPGVMLGALLARGLAADPTDVPCQSFYYMGKLECATAALVLISLVVVTLVGFLHRYCRSLPWIPLIPVAWLLLGVVLTMTLDQAYGMTGMLNTYYTEGALAAWESAVDQAFSGLGMFFLPVFPFSLLFVFSGFYRARLERLFSGDSNGDKPPSLLESTAGVESADRTHAA